MRTTLPLLVRQRAYRLKEPIRPALRKLSLLAVGDLICAAVPIGLFFGRIANLINAELWGKHSDAPWAMVFCNDAVLQKAGITAPTTWDEFAADVEIWADAAGKITRVRLKTSTGDAALDRAIENRVFAGVVLREAPPSDMPMPIVRIRPRTDSFSFGRPDNSPTYVVPSTMRSYPKYTGMNTNGRLGSRR